MIKVKKTLDQILRGRSDANIAFFDLINLMSSLGFDMRIKGSHHLFRKDGVIEKINLQKDKQNAKPYQVRQVRNIIIKYKLGEEYDE